MPHLDRESSQKFRRKFYRRTILFTWLWCTAILNAIEDKHGNDNVFQRTFLTQGGMDLPQIPHRPFAPHVKLQSASEIQVSWLPVLVSNKQAVQYELFSGNDPEYVGYDWVYTAKRLKPGTEYKFKVRACSITGCSDFSLTRSCQTPTNGIHEVKGDWKKPLYGKRRMFLLLMPSLAVITFLTTLIIFSVYFWRFLRYYLWQYSSISFDASFQKGYIPDKIFFPENFADLESGDSQHANCQSNSAFVQFDNSNEIKRSAQDFHAGNMATKIEDCDHKGDQPNLRVARSCSPKSSRERASSLGIKQASQNLTGTRIRSISEGEVLTTRTEKAALVTLEEPVVTPVPSKDALVVIDNSNVFIGAREAACAQNPKLRPRHIKVRLQALTQVLENGRNVTKRFACGSSPPANEHVWDVYRRLGYTIDLEDRRGKDEQRVDEQLHLCIYKAIIEMPSQTLVLASGDGNRGKSSGGTSFPECVSAAIEHGWKVEVHSWKHSLSAEWLKIAAKHKESFKIQYLDENINKITFVDTRVRSRERTEEGPKEKKEDNRFRA